MVFTLPPVMHCPFLLGARPSIRALISPIVARINMAIKEARDSLQGEFRDAKVGWFVCYACLGQNLRQCRQWSCSLVMLA